MDFEIKRGYKDRLMNEDGSPKIDLQDGCWYLTLDTAEVFVAINRDGVLDLYKINEAPGIDVEEFNDRFDDIESRLEALENKADQESEITFAEYSQFPSLGEINKLYIALDEKSSYIWDGDSYVKIGGESTTDIELINGGSAIDD